MEHLKHIFRTAVKNVWFNRKQYAFFAVFLILIQSLISGIILFNYNSNENELKYLQENCTVQVEGSSRSYPYHISFGNMTPEEQAFLINEYQNTQDVLKFWEPVSNKRIGSTGKCYTYIRFYDTENAYEQYEKFRHTRAYQEVIKDEDLIVEVTPLLTATQTRQDNNRLIAWVCIAITLVGTVMFALLFNTVVNHFKFSYGIYMTYGANFRKLLSSALCEMFVLDLFTVIPSFLLSLLITFFLTLRAGNGIRVLVFPLFIALLCSFVLTFAAVTFVIRHLSRQTPNKLIASINNVGMISSPRTSVSLPAKGFPVKTELLSMRRFRRYILGLVLSVLIFAGAFCGGIYGMEAEIQKEGVEKPQFLLHFPEGHAIDTETSATAATVGEEEPAEPSPEETEEPPRDFAPGQTYTPEIRDMLYGIDGVEYVTKDRTFDAVVPDHMMVASEKVTMAGKSASASMNNGRRAFTNLIYHLTDGEVIDGLLRQGYTVSGDMQSVLNGDRVIAISDSLNNKQALKLKPGDKVRLTVGKTQNRVLHLENATTDLERLSEYLYSFLFEYEEFTVGAILSDMPAGSGVDIYMNSRDFESMTKTQAYFVDVNLIFKDGATPEQILSANRQLDKMALAYGMTYQNTFRHLEKTSIELKNYPGIILYISILLLAVSVLIATLSQSLFYLMRKQEFDIYLCLGCDLKQIRRLHRIDGTFFAALFGLLYSVFALLSNAIMYWLANLNLAEAVTRYFFHVPGIAFLIGWLVTSLTGFLTVMFSYASYKKKCAPVFTGALADAAFPTTESEEKKSDIFDSDSR